MTGCKSQFQVKVIKLIGYCHLRLECRLQNVRVLNSKIAKTSWRSANSAYRIPTTDIAVLCLNSPIGNILFVERKLLFIIHADIALKVLLSLATTPCYFFKTRAWVVSHYTTIL